MARHVVIGSDDLVTGSVVMKWGDAVTANVTSRNDLVTGSNISMWGVGPCLCRVPITIDGSITAYYYCSNGFITTHYSGPQQVVLGSLLPITDPPNLQLVLMRL